MESAQKVLTGIIDELGPEYLTREPYKVYRKLTAARVPALTARLVLITLAAGAPRKAETMSEVALAASFRKTCALQEGAAAQMAALYKAVFSPDSLARWTEKKDAGFREFCGRSWDFKWAGSSVWRGSRRSGADDVCDAEVRATLRVADPDKAYETAAPVLSENPHAAAEAVFAVFREELAETLDVALGDYVDAEEYYEPYMEEFVSQFAADEFEESCHTLGLAIESLTGSGSSSWI